MREYIDFAEVTCDVDVDRLPPETITLEMHKRLGGILVKEQRHIVHQASSIRSSGDSFGIDEAIATRNSNVADTK